MGQNETKWAENSKIPFGPFVFFVEDQKTVMPAGQRHFNQRTGPPEFIPASFPPERHRVRGVARRISVLLCASVVKGSLQVRLPWSSPNILASAPARG